MDFRGLLYGDVAPAVVWMAGYDLLTEDCYVFLGRAECDALF